ncbi:hypothetical protein BDK51DRAFT_51818 [Blyttiomyces helicus]|uniref:Uncharacterized protein n=1 Tax=Blyttiomyces helicus TaxID=388810 RepID=A0A4P9WB14_9FUNG|nr:hypothetical protein BDK51DRAFT_51818 [Blyttiomyces helicus]|eukprot:RKO88775.1 hypothetical protein BDK51DRAFT_51818 [Blyttiomyces helicus]
MLLVFLEAVAEVSQRYLFDCALRKQEIIGRTCLLAAPGGPSSDATLTRSHFLACGGQEGSSLNAPSMGRALFPGPLHFPSSPLTWGPNVVTMLLDLLPPIDSETRQAHDFKEVEVLANLAIELNVPQDATLNEAFELLVEVAGTRDFMPAASSLHQWLLSKKAMREAEGCVGSFVCWEDLNAVRQELSTVLLESGRREEPRAAGRAKVGGMVGASGSKAAAKVAESAPPPAPRPRSTMRYDPTLKEIDTTEILSLGLARKQAVEVPGITAPLPYRAGAPLNFLGPPLLSRYEAVPPAWRRGTGDGAEPGIFVKFVTKTAADAAAAAASVRAQAALQRDPRTATSFMHARPLPCISIHRGGGAGQTQEEIAAVGPMDLQLVTNWCDEPEAGPSPHKRARPNPTPDFFSSYVGAHAYYSSLFPDAITYSLQLQHLQELQQLHEKQQLDANRLGDLALDGQRVIDPQYLEYRRQIWTLQLSQQQQQLQQLQQQLPQQQLPQPQQQDQQQPQQPQQQQQQKPKQEQQQPLPPPPPPRPPQQQPPQLPLQEFFEKLPLLQLQYGLMDFARSRAAAAPPTPPPHAAVAEGPAAPSGDSPTAKVKPPVFMYQNRRSKNNADEG